MSNYQEDVKSQFKEKFVDNEYGKTVEENATENGEKLTEQEKEELKRFNFPTKVRVALGARVGFICSYPGCGQVTLGPDEGKEDFVILGEAAHIYGAIKPKDGKSTRIPRPAPSNVTEDDIKSIDNGIWLCRHHHRLIDAIWSEEEHTPSELRRWKELAEERQKQDLRVPEHKVIKKFFDRLDDFDCDYVDINNFKDEDWLIILYLDGNNRFSGDRTIGNYASWLNSVGIKPSKAGLELGGWNNDIWKFKWPQDRMENLSSIVEFGSEDDSISTSYNYEALVNDLYDMDENYYKLMLDELKTKY